MAVMRHCYTAYSLNIRSEIELPELCQSSPTENEADLVVRLGKLSTWVTAGFKQISPCIWVSANELQLEVPSIARFLVSGGNKIIVEPFPGVDETAVRVFLLGSALGAALFQRGYLVLHGNAIEVADKCFICVGRSGVGKSTLAAAFMQRGYRVLADDVVPVDDLGLAAPGFPRIKIWRDVADKLGIDTTKLTRIRPELQKFSLPLGERFCDVPRNVSKIFVLAEHNGDSVVCASISGVDKFNVLQANTYRHRFMAGMALQPIHLRQCGALAAQVSVAKILRPKHDFKLDDLVDRLLDEIADD